MCIKDKQMSKLFTEVVRNQEMPPHGETLSQIPQCPLSAIWTRQIENKARIYQS